MAILHFINSRKQQTASGMLFVLRYTMQDKKTIANDGKKYVTGVNCTPQSAYTEFNNTKRLYDKNDGRLYYHFVQSFSVDENISPQTAHEIALRFAEETQKFNGFEIVVSTHCDRNHIHSHFVMNSVNADTGKKFHISEKEVEMLMKISDNICREYGLSVIEPKAENKRAKPMSDREYRSAENGQSWKIRLEAVISTAMQTASSKEHFIMLMEAEGYGVKWTDTRKNITYTTPDGKACRDNKLHYQKFLKESMENEFIYRAQISAKFYNRNTTETYCGRKGSPLRSSDRTKLDGNDIYTESTDRIIAEYSEDSSYTYNREGYESVYGESVNSTDAIYRRNKIGNSRVSESNGNISFATESEHPIFDVRYRETGWENEREFFEQYLYDLQSGGRQTEQGYEQTCVDVNDTFSDTYSIGNIASSIIGDLSHIGCGDRRVEDATTKYFPPERKKNHGPVMGGM